MITLAQITMNSGDDIPGSTIKWNIRNNAHKFDRVIVVDGNLTDSAKAFYNQFDNIDYLDCPWEDSYVKQYRAFSDCLQNGEWCLYFDCDEAPSEDLLEYLSKFKPPKDCNMIKLPCVLHITEDGKHYYPAENQPEHEFKGQWTKSILFKRTETLQFRHFGSHVLPNHGQSEKSIYIPYPYYHMKSLESFVYNDVYQAFLCPEGQQYTLVEAALFKLFTRQYKTTAEFKKATKEGKWPVTLQKFAKNHAKDFNKPISRLSWVYWILEGNKDNSPIPFDLKWEDVKQYVLGKESMELIKKNKEDEKFIKIT